MLAPSHITADLRYTAKKKHKKEKHTELVSSCLSKFSLQKISTVLPHPSPVACQHGRPQIRHLAALRIRAEAQGPRQQPEEQHQRQPQEAGSLRENQGIGRGAHELIAGEEEGQSHLQIWAELFQ